ncbi:MAG: hypothetical protein KF830_06025 [Planctomycetes bacterium]|nr:hypothetical protein [Planctomycetota bacterium]
MENLPALSGIVPARQVHDRQAGSRRQADLFRRALQQEAGDGQAADPGRAEPPVRPGLQRGGANGRKDAGAAARHVDVLA